MAGPAPRRRHAGRRAPRGDPGGRRGGLRAASGYHGAVAGRHRPGGGHLQGADLRALRVQARAARRRSLDAHVERDLPPPAGQRRRPARRARSACAAASTPSSSFVEEHREAWRALFRDAADPEVRRRHRRASRRRRRASSPRSSPPTPTRRTPSADAARIEMHAAAAVGRRARRSPTGGTTIRTSRARRSSTA